MVYTFTDSCETFEEEKEKRKDPFRRVSDHKDLPHLRHDLRGYSLPQTPVTALGGTQVWSIALLNSVCASPKNPHWDCQL